MPINTGSICTVEFRRALPTTLATTASIEAGRPTRLRMSPNCRLVATGDSSTPARLRREINPRHNVSSAQIADTFAEHFSLVTTTRRRANPNPRVDNGVHFAVITSCALCRSADCRRGASRSPARISSRRRHHQRVVAFPGVSKMILSLAPRTGTSSIAILLRFGFSTRIFIV